jgi:hypothetical protein
MHHFIQFLINLNFFEDYFILLQTIFTINYYDNTLKMFLRKISILFREKYLIQ